MKKIFLLALAMVGLVSCNKTPEYQLTGHFSDLTADSLVVYVINETFTQYDYMDTIAVTDGSFQFNLKEPGLREVMISTLAKEGQEPSQQINFTALLVPGEYAHVEGTTEEFYYSGSPFYEDYNTYDRLATPISQKTIELRQEAMKLQDLEESVRDSAMVELTNKYQEIQNELSAVAKDFIKQNSAKDAAVYVLATLSGKDFDEAKELVAPEAMNGKLANFIKVYTNRRDKELAREEAAKKIQEGLEAPDFTVKSPEGKDVTLSGLRGKAVVLDFWGSWCHWCIKGIPDMKEAYKKHSDKVEFLSIACNDTDEKWRAALEEQQMPWLQAINGEGSNDVSTLYALQGYPTKIVIDAEGKIAKIVVGEDPDFYTYLDEQFK